MQAGGWLVVAIDGKTVRGARNKTGKAPHLVAALAHGIGVVPGQVAVDEKSNEIPAVRELLKAFTHWPGWSSRSTQCTRSTTPRRPSSAGAPAM